MQVYRDVTEFGKNTAVALGLFDGVHLGHRAVIECATSQKKNGLVPAVLTFSTDHLIPRRKQGMKRILTDRLRFAYLEQLGIEVVEMPAFERIQNFSPEEFVERILVKALHAKVVACGYDFRFGKDAAGDIHLLRTLCDRFGIRLLAVPVLLDEGKPVSSTCIRHCLTEGDIPAANRLLGYDYCIDFEVAHGLEIGRKIGIPTINQIYPEQFVIPRFGVYASYAIVEGKRYKSITNVGVKPTIAGERFPLAETYIIGVGAHLYGQNIKVSFKEFVRGERKFAGIDELAAEIRANIEQIKRMPY